MNHILCLDIDGVLHPSDCKVLLDFNAPAWLLATQARTQGLLRWTDQLNQCLQGSDVRLLVHSTWRRRASDRALQELLGPELGGRIIVTDAWISPQDRVNMSHAAYISSVLEIASEQSLGKQAAEGGVEGDVEGEGTARHAYSVCILDDRPALFDEDRPLLDAWAPLFVWTDGGVGISDSRIQAHLAQWVHKSHQEPHQESGVSDHDQAPVSGPSL